MAGNDSVETERRGTWWQRMLIWLFSLVLTVLIYWLLGFVLEDIGRMPGPNWSQLESELLDPALKIREQELASQISEVNREIDNQRRRQQLLRDSTASSQKTLSQLLELLRITIEQNAELPPEQQQALADSQQMFLANQRKDQEYNESLSSLQEQLTELEEQQRIHRRELETARQPVLEEFNLQKRRHDWRVAAVKIGFLIPLLVIGSYLFARHRSSRYVPIIYALDTALLVKTFLVMHEYFPKEYFKYVLIVSSLIVIGVLLARLLKTVAEPGREARLKQSREAYESFFCPVCQFPIRRGPLRFMSWSPRSLRKRSQPIENTRDEPYTCPSCATPLFEKCTNCGKVRHSLLPACEFCGAQVEV